MFTLSTRYFVDVECRIQCIWMRNCCSFGYSATGTWSFWSNSDTVVNVCASNSLFLVTFVSPRISACGWSFQSTLHATERFFAYNAFRAIAVNVLNRQEIFRKSRLSWCLLVLTLVLVAFWCLRANTKPRWFVPMRATRQHQPEISLVP